MWRHFAYAAHLTAVPVDLTCTVNIGQIKGEVDIRRRVGCEFDAPPVPGEARVAPITLIVPWLAGLDLLPYGVIECGRGPCKVVADMKLSGAIEWNSRLAQVADHERRGLR
jgi:hypothetical protein